MQRRTNTEIDPARRRFLQQSGILIAGAWLQGCGGGGGGGGTASPLPTPPAIEQHPLSISVIEGEAARFEVRASGSGPLTFQWLRDGQVISGAVSSAYTLLTTSLADDGATFRVDVGSSTGVVSSATATLHVAGAQAAPAFTLEPIDQTVYIGDSVAFEAAAVGPGVLAFQWYRGGIAIAGATGRTHTIMLAADTDNGAGFSVSVSNQFSSVFSRTAILTVSPKGTTVDATTITVDSTDTSTDEI